VKKWVEENPGLVACFGVPLAGALMFALGPVGGVIGIVVFLWVVFSNARIDGPGGSDGPWDGFGRP
jgi:hypothetical protein